MNNMKEKILKLIRKYLTDIIYGANDGIVTTVAVVSSVTGASLPTYVILILGFANLFADGLSMAASDYLSNRSQTVKSKQLTRQMAIYSGIATFLGFVIAGFVPLSAYLFPFRSGSHFFWALIFAFITLFSIGSGKSIFTQRNWFREGLEMLIVGMAASAIAYLIGVIGSSFVRSIGIN